MTSSGFSTRSCQSWSEKSGHFCSTSGYVLPGVPLQVTVSPSEYKVVSQPAILSKQQGCKLWRTLLQPTARSQAPVHIHSHYCNNSLDLKTILCHYFPKRSLQCGWRAQLGGVEVLLPPPRAQPHTSHTRSACAAVGCVHVPGCMDRLKSHTWLQRTCPATE